MPSILEYTNKIRKKLGLKDGEANIAIGHVCKDNHHFFDEVRNLKFALLKDGESNVRVELSGISSNLTPDCYYVFYWEIIELQGQVNICVDSTKRVESLDPKYLINNLYHKWADTDPSVLVTMSDVMNMVKNQLTSSFDGTFIYELLQNANDYPEKDENDNDIPVNVEFHLWGRNLLVKHSGAPFKADNVAAICNLNAGQKKENKSAIGYKGIGFKTVFVGSDQVSIVSGDYKFQFVMPDGNDDADITDIPWQIMPKWMETVAFDGVPSSVMTDKAFNVQTIIHSISDSYFDGIEFTQGLDKNERKKTKTELLEELFSDLESIIFIPNIQSVKVFKDGELMLPPLTKDMTKWILSEPYLYKYSSEEVMENNEEIAKESKIPDKYKDNEDTRVSFACKRDGDKAIACPESKIYCYLPTQISFGFPFLMNTDMIPTGPRDDVEPKLAFNKRIMRIAGLKFFDWIKDLLRNGFDPESAFTLIPDFADCLKLINNDDKRGFISAFENGFKSRVAAEAFIPMEDGTYGTVKDVLYDETGFTASGLVSDREFATLTGVDTKLAVKSLRCSEPFLKFLATYGKDAEKFERENLYTAVRNEHFQEWLKNKKHNSDFIRFILEKGEFGWFHDEPIFLDEVNGELHKDEVLCETIEDKYLSKLKAFRHHMMYLSVDTYQEFHEHKNWREKQAFKEFDVENFIDEVLRSDKNIAETKELLCNKVTNLNFFEILATVPWGDCYLELPFIDFTGNVVDDFNDKILYFGNQEGYDLCKASWLSEISVRFLSTEYSAETCTYFKKHFGVADFSDKSMVTDVILPHHEEINQSIGDDLDASLEFVEYCYKHRAHLGDKTLKKFVLLCYDCSNEEQWCMATDNVMYFDADLFDAMMEKNWIDPEWMYSMDDIYFRHHRGEAEYKKFLTSKFGVKDISEELFFEDVVSPNISNILEYVKDMNDISKSADFVEYLDDNYSLIFENNAQAVPKLRQLVIHDINGDAVSLANDNVYLFDMELTKITQENWFPGQTVSVATDVYGTSAALVKLGAAIYSYREFFEKIISAKVNDINRLIEDKSTSIALHTFLIEKKDCGYSESNWATIRQFKVYLMGRMNPFIGVPHKLISEKAKEIIDSGLINTSEMFLLDPDYPQDYKYWRDGLKYESFTPNMMIECIRKNFVQYSAKLRDVKLNITFWSWVRKNFDLIIKKADVIKGLPVLLANGAYGKIEDVYLSNEYQAGIEHIVSTFIPSASFINSVYVKESGIDSLNWKTLWIDLGIKSDIIEILTDVISNRLETTKIPSLLQEIANRRTTLAVIFGSEEELAKRLRALYVECTSGEFKQLKDTVFITNNDGEPFPYIQLPNHIATNDNLVRDLILKVLDKDAIVSDDLDKWQNLKINEYVRLQNIGYERVKGFHADFIKDIAAADISFQTFQKFEKIKEIKLLDRSDVLMPCGSLTAGHKYNPYFDFEECGISAAYVNDCYYASKNLRTLFRWLGVKVDFKEADFNLLSSYRCAVYFWTTYLTKKSKNADSYTEIVKLLTAEKLNQLQCVPTKSKVKKPVELYYGKDVMDLGKYVDGLEEYIPLNDIPEYPLKDGNTAFSRLGFGLKLNFEHCLKALLKVSPKDERNRKTLLRWILDSKIVNEDAVTDYRISQDAIWVNGKKNKSHITELYALASGDKGWESCFGSNERLINKSYFPGGEDFEAVCKILRIPVLYPKDTPETYEGKILDHSFDKNLKVAMLVLAALSDIENWKSTADKYNERFNSLSLYNCASIKLQYKEVPEISSSWKKFYHAKGSSEMHFVQSLNNPIVFKDFASAFIDYIGILEVNIDMATLALLSWETSIDIVNSNENLLENKEFISSLLEICPEASKLLNTDSPEPDYDSVAPENQHNTIEDRKIVEVSFEPSDESEHEEDEIFDNSPVTEDRNSGEIHSNDSSKPNDEEEILNVEDFSGDLGELEAIDDSGARIDLNEFTHATKDVILVNGEQFEVVSEHYRSGTYVRGHYRNGYWVNGYWRNGSTVGPHTRISPTHELTTNGAGSKPMAGTDSANRPTDIGIGASHQESGNGYKQSPSAGGESSGLPNSHRTKSQHSSDGDSQNDNSSNTRSFGKDHGVNSGGPDKFTNGTPRRRTKTVTGLWPERPRKPQGDYNTGDRDITGIEMSTKSATNDEICKIKEILDPALTNQQIEDQSYLVRLRAYNRLKESGFEPNSGLKEFLISKNNDRQLNNGKHAHFCSAARGYMYISPFVWQRVMSGEYIVVVYYGKKAHDFFIIKDKDDLLSYVNRGPIMIKVSGDERADVVDRIYSTEWPNGSQGKVYTVIPIFSNEDTSEEIDINQFDDADLEF